MDTLSQTTASDARRIEANLLRAVAKVGNQAIADAIGRDESLVSRWKSEGKFAQTAQVIAVLGLKVVPASQKCFEPQYIDALRMLARQALDEPAQALEWG